MDELLRNYLMARLWRETARPLREIEALGGDELSVLAATVPGLADGLEAWRENLQWLAAMGEGGGDAPEADEPEADARPAGKSLPGFDRPVDRALAIAGAVSHGREFAR